MIRAEFEKQLQEALALELHYENRFHLSHRSEGNLGLPAPAHEISGGPGAHADFSLAKATPASVLVLFAYPQVPAQPGKPEVLPSLLYIRRTEEVETHKGQIAFPGGHTEPEELDHPELTALRETEEEVGISRDHVKLYGRLPALFTPTGYLIQPFVGVLNRPLEEVSLTLDPQETAEAIWVPLDVLLCPGVYQAQTFQVGSGNYPIDVYQYQHHRIWGATGSMTKNLLDRLSKSSKLS